MNPRGPQQISSSASRSTKSARINLRVTPADKALLLGAAKATGVDLSTFIVTSARERALEVRAVRES